MIENNSRNAAHINETYLPTMPSTVIVAGPGTFVLETNRIFEDQSMYENPKIRSNNAQSQQFCELRLKGSTKLFYKQATWPRTWIILFAKGAEENWRTVFT